jgi:hypothetical protein
MYSRSLEVSKPWMVWRYGLGIFAGIVFLGGWFLTDEVRLPSAKQYVPVVDSDQDDVSEGEIEDEEDRLWREEGDIEAISPKITKRVRPAEANKMPVQDDLDGSSDDEFVQGVSKHLLSREH